MSIEEIEAELLALMRRAGELFIELKRGFDDEGREEGEFIVAASVLQGRLLASLAAGAGESDGE